MPSFVLFFLKAIFALINFIAEFLDVRLFRGADPLKDQTHFLSSLSQEQLRRVMFPIGSLYKPRVREIAKTAGFHIHDKAESMGICFVGNRRDFDDFLAKAIQFLLLKKFENFSILIPHLVC